MLHDQRTFLQYSTKILIQSSIYQKSYCKHLIFDTTYLHVNVLELILEQEEIICGSNRNNIFGGVPCSMQYLLVKVQTIHANLILLTFTTGTDLDAMQKSFNDPKDHKTLLSLKQMSLEHKDKHQKQLIPRFFFHKITN